VASAAEASRAQAPTKAELPAHVKRFRVDSAHGTVRHDPQLLPEVVEGAADEPDLFRLLPASPRRAFDLGILSSDPYFHVFVEAADDVDVLHAVVARAKQRLRGRGAPNDVVYVHDFDRPASPRPILLPAGWAPLLQEGVQQLLTSIAERLPQIDADQDVKAARQALTQEMKARHKDALGELETLAKGLSFGIKTVSGGVQTFPILHGKPVSAEQFEVLDESTKKQLTEAEEKLSQAIEVAAEKVRVSTRDLEEASAALEEKAARHVVEEEAAPLLERFAEVPAAHTFLARVIEELVDSVDDVRAASSGPPKKEEEESTDPEIATRLRRFAVNVFVTHAVDEESVEEEDEPPPSSERQPVIREVKEAEPPSPPVLYEDNPTFANLFGFLERRVHLGSLVSDFSRIRPGGLHRASGGVLVLRARDLIQDALAWDRLKRVMRARAVGHEDPIGPMGLYATTLRPKPCPISTKVVLVGSHDLYASLLEADPDFAAFFRVKVEIPSDIDRHAAGIRALDAHMVRMANRRGWGPLDRTARARALDYACRLAEDARKLALFLQPIEETMAFATVIAHERTEREVALAPPPDDDAPPPSIPPPPRPRTGVGQPPPPVDRTPIVAAQDMDAAWQERRDRTAGAERQIREMVVAGEVLVATEGERIGVVNGLSVLSAGDVQFGHPMRITSVVSVGHEGLIDVEREAALGGALHTKGVAILRGFLSGTFGQERPVALRAQIAFEQSYGEVEGDSASSTELYAILSAIADVNIDQGIAVTGSVNQLGEVQAIGGVTAKVEGFFDLCAARGLSGRQGVMIPRSCLNQLVLRDDVAAAIAAETFHLFAVDRVSEGIEVLTGIVAGARDASGRFPAESIFGRVERRLIEIAERMRRAEGPGGEVVGAAIEEEGRES
jgi:predicted ATP-dependent protease